MKIGSLFSGLGGLEKGLEDAGLGTVAWQCEIDPFCRSVLAKHWPDARRYEDVRTVDATAPPVDVICGGFPCTDLSLAARGVARTGLEGEQSGLWREMLRIVGLLMPRFVVIENVAAAWRQWLPFVRSDLYGIGYSCVPIQMRAADVGLPHGRSRVFVVAYTNSDCERLGTVYAEARRCAPDVALRSAWAEDTAELLGSSDGVPDRMDARRLRALGNAVVPACAEVIGRAIMEAIR